jgi:peptidoglycan/xylan/chitin deacetylase (PgdA/CDA1 family)
LNRVLHLAVILGVFLITPAPAHSQTLRVDITRLYGAIVRGDSSRPELALVFTGDTFADGASHIADVLAREGVKGSFFFTGNFYRNPDFEHFIISLKKNGHYLGAHSDQHLLYCDWSRRDSLLVTRKEFTQDLVENYRAMRALGINRDDASLFLPPYEWYNDSIASWTGSMGLQLVNLTYGTLSHADYTIPGTSAYRGSREIYQSILEYETSSSAGLNGFILLMHVGTDPQRTDKFYFYLQQLLTDLKSRGYRFRRIDELLYRTNERKPLEQTGVDSRRK